MAIDPNIFLHEADKAALDSLKAIPGFTGLLKVYMKNWNEKLFYLQNMSSNVRISDKQLKKYRDMLVPICQKLQIEVPDLFLQLSPYPNSYTSGDTKPFIVITSGLIEALPERLIPTVLAHECGHIVCHHVLYRTMGQLILNGALFALLGQSIAGLITQPIRAAFYYWMRCSEFSADRAAVLCDGSPDKMIEVCARLAGFSKSIDEEIDMDAFIEQAEEYRQLVKDNALNKTMEFMAFGYNTHPLNAVRACEAKEWTKTAEFAKAHDYFAACLAHIQPKEAPLPGNEKSFIGRDYEEVLEILEKAGFTPEISRVIDRNILQRPGAVNEVIINGTKRYKEGDWLKTDARIEVRYYQPLTEEEEEALHPGEIRLDNDLSYYRNKDLKEVKESLYAQGIVNTVFIPVCDLKHKDERSFNKVIEVKIEDLDHPRKGDWIPILNQCIVTYHELKED